MENKKLIALCNKIICNYHGASAGVIFDYLIHSDYIYAGFKFTIVDIENEFMFMNEVELVNAVNELISNRYIARESDNFMVLTNKALAFIPEQDEE